MRKIPDLCIHQLLESQAQRTPDAIAITAPGRTPLTYRQLLWQIDNVVAWLNSIGVGRNDRVAIALPNGPEMAVAFLAVAAGATCAPLNPADRSHEFDFYLSDLNAKAVIIQSGINSPLKAVAQAQGIEIIELSPVLEAAGMFTLAGGEPKSPAHNGFAQSNDVALVLHTSGTTSRPKIVPLLHSNLCTCAHNIRAALDLSAGDRCLNVMPLFHIHGLIGALLSSLSAGASVICTPGFYAPKICAWWSEFRPTWYTAVPTMHQAILARADAVREIIAHSPPRLIRSSSASLPPQVMAELELVFNAPVIESYGMTEASHQMTSNPLPPKERQPGSVGIAAGPEIAIMDELGNLLPTGEIGEIVIRGANVTQGYENNPKANESAFTHGWFRTGDLGYLDPERYLFIKGRIKEIINRGGEKISPREVDEVLLEHPTVAQAVTFAVPHPQLGEDVAAAIVLHELAAVTPREIQEFAAVRLADFKVPRLVIFVDEIPQGPTGKLQRIGLAEKLGITASEEQPEAFTPPQTTVEEKLVEIWSEVLGVKQVGIHDNFFQLGGDSILAAQILNRVREALQLELSFLVFFETPTIAGIANNLQGQQVALPSLSIQARSKTETQPLSFTQVGMWLFNKLEPSNPAFNRPLVVRFTGALNVAALEQSLNEILRRHEVLRTTFPIVDGQPIQAIAPAENRNLSVIDLSHLPETQQEVEASKQMAIYAKLPFNLTQDPMVRATLLRLNQEEHVLLLTIHHIVFDGWSESVLRREVAVLYQAFCNGKRSPLPELPIQYTDFAHWQRQWFPGEKLNSQLAYWKQQLHDAPPVLELPTDRPRPPVQTFRGARQSLLLPTSLSKSLKAIAQQERVTLFMTLLAAFQTLLHRYTGQDDIIVGSPVAGRDRVETEKLIGVFINTLVLRTSLAGNPTFLSLLGRVRGMALGAFAHQDLPFEKLVEELQPERDLSRTPLFQVMFQLRNVPNPVVEVQGLRIDDFEFDSGIAILDLALDVVDKPEGLSCLFNYNTDLFDASTIKRMAGHFQTLLEAIVENPQQRVAELPLLTAAERHQLLVEWNDTRAEYPQDACIHQLFEEQVEKSPQAVAVVFEDQQLTYRELNARANQLAHYLQALGVGPEVLVGICVERSLEMIVGLLGILKAGGAYVPLDPAYPKERLTFMLSDTQVPILLTQQQLVQKLPEHRASLVCLDTDGQAISQESKENPNSSVTSKNLAYAIYTSGSTGKPKGVLVAHQGLCNLATAQICTFNVQPNSRVLQFASLSFDAFIGETVMAVGAGASLYLGTLDSLLPGSVLMQFLREQNITHVLLPPSALAVLPSEELPALQTIIVAGEACSPNLVAQWSKDRSFFNAYGPTEATVYATVAACSGQNIIVPIGKPIANTQVYILDSHLQPVAIGVPGELYISGVGLARGYLNRPDLTQNKFIPNTFSNEPEARLYKTGDLARYLPDGNIEFLGRIDQQVKIRGFRIELGEIEAVLSQNPAVLQTVAIAREDVPGDKRLVAYVVPNPEQAPTSSELRRFLKQKLPDYMVPSTFVMLETLPLTPNGKVDRRALPAPDQVRQPEETFVAPQDELELQLKKIWEKVLGIRSISVKDDFFDLGGNSLLAVRVFSNIEKIFGKNLTLSTLLLAPTVEQLASILRQKGWSPSWESLVAIQPRGSKPPLFCVHAVAGDILFYRNLLPYLGSNQPVYGLQAQGLDGKKPPLTQIEEMAACYIKELQIIQPEGPYFLVGYCLGGIVAFEMAQQLLVKGQKVAELVLIDSPCPTLLPNNFLPLHQIVSIHLSNFWQSEPKYKLNYLSASVKWQIKQMFQKMTNIYQHTQESSNTTYKYLEAVRKANSYAAKNYVPQVYPGRITLLRTKPPKYYHALDFGWSNVAGGGLDIQDIYGGHIVIMGEPLVRVVGEKLKACLDE